MINVVITKTSGGKYHAYIPEASHRFSSTKPDIESLIADIIPNIDGLSRSRDDDFVQREYTNLSKEEQKICETAFEKVFG